MDISNINVFSSIGGTIEASLIEPAQQIAESISGNMLPFVAGGLTIWVMVYALATVRGAVHAPVSDFTWRAVKICLILFFGIGGGIFQADAHGFYSEVSNTVFDAINRSSGGTCAVPAKDPIGIYTALDCSVKESLKPLLKTTEKVGELVAPDDADALDIAANIGSYIIQLFLFIGIFIVSLLLTIVMVAYMGFEIIALRVSLALAFALSPIFIFALLFEPIKSLFSNWLNFVIKSVLMQALFVTFMGVAFGAVANLIGQMFETSVKGLLPMLMASFTGLLSFSIMMVIFTFVAARLPSLASELSGGGAGSAGLGTLLTAAAGKQLARWTGGKLGGGSSGKKGGELSGNS